jgi:hypothetical protein
VLEYLEGGLLLDAICSFQTYSEDIVRGIILQLVE